MPSTRRDLIRMRYRRARTTASEIRWFAVLALLAVVSGVVLAALNQSIQLVGAVVISAVALAVLATRED